MQIISIVLLTIALALSPRALSSALEKWQRTEDGTLYYLDAEHKYNWFEAWNHCARMNMSLLMVDSPYKHQQIDQMLRKLFSVCPNIWLAAHENAIDRSYEWATTGQSLNFTNWANGEPNRYGNTEHCLLIWEKTWEWYDISCWAKSGYICEANLLIKAKDEELKEIRESFATKEQELKQLRDLCAAKDQQLKELREPCAATDKYRSIVFNINPK